VIDLAHFRIEGCAGRSGHAQLHPHPLSQRRDLQVGIREARRRTRDRRQRLTRVLSGTARQGGIPGRQEDQVVEVSAGQAKCAAFPGKADPRAAPQFLTTFIASGLAGGDEHLQILRGLHDLTGLHLNWMAFAIQSLLSRGQCAQ
jgi:hypothetical protein